MTNCAQIFTGLLFNAFVEIHQVRTLVFNNYQYCPVSLSVKLRKVLPPFIFTLSFVKFFNQQFRLTPSPTCSQTSTLLSPLLDLWGYIDHHSSQVLYQIFHKDTLILYNIFLFRFSRKFCFANFVAKQEMSRGLGPMLSTTNA